MKQQHAIYGNFTNFRYFITPDGQFEEMTKVEVKPNDLIMQLLEEPVGKTVIIAEKMRQEE
ncbi:MAG: hypothetical protein ACOXZY_00885 [Patescibacteria group bacterium]